MLAQELEKRINNRTLSAIKNSWNLLNYQIYDSYFSQNFSELVFLTPLDTCLGPLHKKWSFQFRISSANETKSAVSYGFGHIYWRNS